LEYWAAVEETRNASVLTLQEYNSNNNSSDALNVDGWTIISKENTTERLGRFLGI
jgi:hypothetical protein